MKKTILISILIISLGNVFSQNQDYSSETIIQDSVEITLNITISNGLIPPHIEVILTGYNFYFIDTIFPGIPWGGLPPVAPYNFYDLFVNAPGYDPYELLDLFPVADMTIEVLLQEIKYPPRNAIFNPLTSVLSWEKPRIYEMLECFEGTLFPPECWQTRPDPGLWHATQNGSGGSFIIPDWDSKYACINDTINNNVDTLISPALELHEHEQYYLVFDSYFDGQGDVAEIFYSRDEWQTATLLQQLLPASEWQEVVIDLSEFSGPFQGHVWFGFAGTQWAIDNVEVCVLEDTVPKVLAYHVFLDDQFMGETTEFSWFYDTLEYGGQYTASVGALYSSGLSEKEYVNFTSDFLYPPRNLVAANYDDAVLLQWEPPLMPDTSISSNRDLWDVQFVYPVGFGGGEAGTESDGNYIYTTKWNGEDFYRYELDGTYVGSFQVPGAANIRDLAYDGEFFYGGAAATTCYIMDFDNEVLEGTINAPVAIRAIAYDEDFDSFWANNYSNDITLFDKNGVQLNSFPVGSYGSYYGFAWDNSQEGGPYLYGFSQEGSGAEIVEIEIATGQETGFTYDAVTLGSSSDIAGGLYIQDNIVSGMKTLGGLLQNSVLFGLELGQTGSVTNYIVPENLLGFNLYKDDELMVYFEYDTTQNTFEYWDYVAMEWGGLLETVEIFCNCNI